MTRIIDMESISAIMGHNSNDETTYNNKILLIASEKIKKRKQIRSYLCQQILWRVGGKAVVHG